MDEPLVSCVMVTKTTPEYLDSFIPLAIECFENQTYPNRELLIVSEDPRILLGDLAGCEGVRVFCFDLPTLGELRNAALDAAQGDFRVQWDADDWHHPERLSLQMQAALQNPGCPVFLKRQCCYETARDVMYLRDFHEQFPCIIGTILHPKDGRRYPAMRQHEDLEFAKTWPLSEWRIIDDDPPHPLAMLYVRQCHGGSTTSRQDVMREAVDYFPGTWAVPQGWHAQLREVTNRWRASCCRDAAPSAFR